MTESQIEKKVTLFATSQGWDSFKFVSPNNRGVPDRVYLKDGEVIFIEFKAPGKKPTKLQVHIHKKFEKQGFPVLVIDSLEQGKKVFNH